MLEGKLERFLLALAVILLLPVFAVADYPAELPRTGQTTCYDTYGAVIDCAGTGQDGAIQAGAAWPVPRFVDNGDGTVTDGLTGLVWAQDANLPDETKTWQEALEYVAGMNSGTNPNFGYSDWRLPNINELESLANFEIYDPALPQGHPFTNVQFTRYCWSSTNYGGAALGVLMLAGLVSDDTKTYNNYVWPVRAGLCGVDNSVICLPNTGQTTCYDADGAVIECAGTGQDGDRLAGVSWPDPRLVDNGDGTVTDALTGLVWAKDANLMVTRDPTFDEDDTAGDGLVYWQHALGYVAKLNMEKYLGYNDWRLPNKRELRSLVDYSRYLGWPMGGPFVNVPENVFAYCWSSTSYASYPIFAWISSYFEPDGYGGKTHCYGYVWPIRAGQVSDSVISTTTTTAGATTIYPAEVARTGQTLCYDMDNKRVDCAGTGQDGAIQAGAVWPVSRFVDNGDGTVTDGLTGLVWAQDANLMVTRDPSFDADGTAEDGAVTWQHALDYVAKLNSESYLGHDNWSLPNINELESLINYEFFNPALPLDHPFVNDHPGYGYWSSTTCDYSVNMSRAWFVGPDGSVGGGDKRGCTFVVWPVRSGQCGALGSSVICLPKTGQLTCYDTDGNRINCAGTGRDGELQHGVAWPYPRFIDNGDGTVLDSLTGLLWAKNGNLMEFRDPFFDNDKTAGDGAVIWQHALDYVTKLKSEKYLGYDDWRLPNIRELRSLFDYGQCSPALPLVHPFTHMFDRHYWSSTTIITHNAFYVGAWVVFSSDGVNEYFDKTSCANVWPVRGGLVGNTLLSSTTTTVAAGSSTTTAPGPATSTTTASSDNTTTTTAAGDTTTTTTAGGDEPCPATQVLGADNPQLDDLRGFRDGTLARSAVGRHIISLYYRNAAAINGVLERNSLLKAMARRVLKTFAQ